MTYENCDSVVGLVNLATACFILVVLLITRKVCIVCECVCACPFML